MEDSKAYNTTDRLFKKYDFDNVHFVCKCKFKMDLLCTSNCGEESIHCNNTDCEYSSEKHMHCRDVKLRGLTDLLQKRFHLYGTFLQRIQKVEQDFIARIRNQREKIFSKFIFREFEDEQIVTLQNLFIRKNVSSVKGIHIEEVYKKLKLEKDYKKKDEQVEQYQNQVKKVETMLNQIRVQLEKPTQKLLLLKQSKIIESKNIEQNKFISECLNNPKELKLLFRASQHQFSAAKFHQLCDGIPNLLVLVKTQFGKVVGGFNSMGWNNTGGWAADTGKKCFIFSVTLRQKMNLIIPENALQNSQNFGPVFGGCDIALSDQCDKNSNSRSNFPYSYNFSSKPYIKNQQTHKIFSGSSTENFGVIEYEVFQVIQ